MFHFQLERLASLIGEIKLRTGAGDHPRGLDRTDHEARPRDLLRVYFDACEISTRDDSTPSLACRALCDDSEGDLIAIDTIAVETNGTNFQRTVWIALRAIQVGRTSTYRAIARQLGRPKTVRAVGRTNGANPISIVLPSHRLIGADGSLTGDRSGIERMRWPLRHAGAG
jgi:methylated-DNA-[protein]-cysteine S-methyltransferase